MTRRSKIWLAAAVLFTLLNLGGMVVAAIGGEMYHAAAHGGLLLLGLLSAYLVWEVGTEQREAGAERHASY